MEDLKIHQFNSRHKKTLFGAGQNESLSKTACNFDACMHHGEKKLLFYLILTSLKNFPKKFNKLGKFETLNECLPKQNTSIRIKCSKIPPLAATLLVSLS